MHIEYEDIYRSLNIYFLFIFKIRLSVKTNELTFISRSGFKVTILCLGLKLIAADTMGFYRTSKN